MVSQQSTITSKAAWAPPRGQMDPSVRLRTYGRLRPLESSLSWWDRLLRR